VQAFQQYNDSNALFVWLISHQPAVLFSQDKSATSNQSTVLFSQNKSAPVTSQTNMLQVLSSRNLLVTRMWDMEAPNENHHVPRTRSWYITHRV
jgi:hypothetical protein